MRYYWYDLIWFGSCNLISQIFSDCINAFKKMHRVFGSSLSSCRHVVQNTWVELVFSGCKTILPTNRFPSLWIVIIPNMLDRKPDPKSNHQLGMTEKNWTLPIWIHFGLGILRESQIAFFRHSHVNIMRTSSRKTLDFPCIYNIYIYVRFPVWMFPAGVASFYATIVNWDHDLLKEAPKNKKTYARHR